MPLVKVDVIRGVQSKEELRKIADIIQDDPPPSLRLSFRPQMRWIHWTLAEVCT